MDIATQGAQDKTQKQTQAAKLLNVSSGSSSSTHGGGLVVLIVRPGVRNGDQCSPVFDPLKCHSAVAWQERTPLPNDTNQKWIYAF